MEIIRKYRYYYITLAILVKVGYLVFFALYSPNENNWNFQQDLFIASGDTDDYIQPVENLIGEGTYYFGSDNFAGRMPGYTVVLLPLRLLFSLTTTLNLTVLFQAILSGFSVYVLAIIAWKIYPRRLIFFTVYVLYLFVTYVSIWDRYIFTESFAISALIFSIYYFQCYQEKFKYKYLFWSGVLFTWAVFLRPFYLPFSFIYLWLLFADKGLMFQRKFFISAFVFLSFFMMADGIWIIRNFKVTGKFIPLQSTTTKGTVSSELNKSLKNFIGSIGGDRINWHHGSEATWFRSDSYLEEMGFTRPFDDIFPNYIFYNDLNLDSLKSARDYIHLSKQKTDSISFSNYQSHAIEILDKFTHRVKKNYPFQYYIVSPVKIARRFTLGQPLNYYLPESLFARKYLSRAYVYANYVANYLVILFGIIGIFFVIIKKGLMPLRYFTIAIPLFILVFFSFWFRTNEYRFLATAYPFFLINAIFLMHYIMHWINNNYHSYKKNVTKEN